MKSKCCLSKLEKSLPNLQTHSSQWSACDKKTSFQICRVCDINEMEFFRKIFFISRKNRNSNVTRSCSGSPLLLSLAVCVSISSRCRHLRRPTLHVISHAKNSENSQMLFILSLSYGHRWSMTVAHHARIEIGRLRENKKCRQYGAASRSRRREWKETYKKKSEFHIIRAWFASCQMCDRVELFCGLLVDRAKERAGRY